MRRLSLAFIFGMGVKLSVPETRPLSHVQRVFVKSDQACARNSSLNIPMDQVPHRSSSKKRCKNGVCLEMLGEPPVCHLVLTGKIFVAVVVLAWVTARRHRILSPDFRTCITGFIWDPHQSIPGFMSNTNK
jgi:hypothetical protein